MEWWIFLLAGLAWWMTNLRGQRRRILWLSGHLRPLQIEQLMETLVDGYLRAQGEADPVRSESIWSLLDEPERQLEEQARTLAQSAATSPPPLARFSRLGFSLPPALLELFPWTASDMRGLLNIHAEGIQRVAANAQNLSRRDRAYMLTAEVLLLQHSCHWFCRSRSVAHARSMARHQTSHAQILASVSESTRRDYRAWLHLR